MPPAKKTPTCFIAMPITTHDHEGTLYGDGDHWNHVLEHLFIPAVVKAGFEPIRPSAVGTSMIHGRIVRHLAEADMVLCDLSQNNPNVFFELGVRTSLNKPIALVTDEQLDLPFDTAGLNTHSYSSKLHIWALEAQIEGLVRHLEESVRESDGGNPMWRHFGVAIKADQPGTDLSPTDALIELLAERVGGLEERLERVSVPSSGAMTRRQRDIAVIVDRLRRVDGVADVRVRITADGLSRIEILTEPSGSEEQRSRIDEVIGVMDSVRYRVGVDHSGPEEIILHVVPRSNRGFTVKQSDI